MDDYQQNLAALQESMQQSMAMMQKAIDGLVAAIAAHHKDLKLSNVEDHHSAMHDLSSAVVDRAQIPFPSFDGSNFMDWKTNAEQFFELENTPEEQRGQLLFLSMEGKAFSWQHHYMQNQACKSKIWTQILQDTSSRFDDAVFDDPVAELAKLKQKGNLLDYLERVDQLLAQVSVTEELTLSSFLSRLQVELEKSVQLHKPNTIQETIRVAKLQDDIIQCLTKKISLGKTPNSDPTDVDTDFDDDHNSSLLTQFKSA